MDSITRIAYSDKGTANRRANIPISDGDWEITQLSVVMGGSTPALNGIEIGFGTVAFEVIDPADNALQIHYLLIGRCLRFFPMVMDCPKRIHGPGRIRSTLRHVSDTEHTLAVTYRRVRD